MRYFALEYCNLDITLIETPEFWLTSNENHETFVPKIQNIREILLSKKLQSLNSSAKFCNDALHWVHLINVVLVYVLKKI